MRPHRYLTYASALCLSTFVAVSMALLGASTPAFAATSSQARSYTGAVMHAVKPPTPLTHAFPLGAERLEPPVANGVQKGGGRTSGGRADRQGGRAARAAGKDSGGSAGLPTWEIIGGSRFGIAVLAGAAILAARRRRRRAIFTETPREVEGALIAGRAQPSRPAYSLIERGPKARHDDPVRLDSPAPEGGEIPAEEAPTEAEAMVARPEGSRGWRSVQGAALLGRRFERGGRLDAAETAYRRASDAGSVGAAYNLGVVRRDRGDREGAEAAFRLAGRRGDADALFNLGLLAFERGDRATAEDAWRRADARGHPLAAANLGYVLISQGDRPGAIAAYVRAKERGDRPGTRYLDLVFSQ